jgi:subtilase family serine protease
MRICSTYSPRSSLVIALLTMLIAACCAAAQDSSAVPSVTTASPRLITQPVDAAQLTLLNGNTHPLARPEFDQGTAPASLPMERMLLVMKRSPEQESALRHLIDDQQDKGSLDYHKWLTPEQLGEQFGPNDSDLQTVTAWLQARGFQVTSLSKGRTAIEFSGSANQVQAAFHTSIHKYVVNGESHTFGASDSAPVQVTGGKENSETKTTLVAYSYPSGTFYQTSTIPYGTIFFLRSDVTNAAGTACAPNPQETQAACPAGSVSFTNNGKTLDAGTYGLNNLGYTEDQTLAPGFTALGSYAFQTQYSGDNSYSSSATTLNATVTQAPTFTEMDIENLPVSYNGTTQVWIADSGQSFTVGVPVYTRIAFNRLPPEPSRFLRMAIRYPVRFPTTPGTEASAETTPLAFSNGPISPGLSTLRSILLGITLSPRPTVGTHTTWDRRAPTRCS